MLESMKNWLRLAAALGLAQRLLPALASLLASSLPPAQPSPSTPPRAWAAEQSYERHPSQLALHEGAIVGDEALRSPRKMIPVVEEAVCHILILLVVLPAHRKGGA